MTVVRGCGTRTKGALYVTVGMSPLGQPLEYFITDPPVPVSQEWLATFGVTPRGQHLVQLQEDGPTHIVDWIGATHYPLPADFLEEARRHGVSRRMSTSLDYSVLTEDSRLVLIHPRGSIANWADYNPSQDACVKQQIGATPPLGHPQQRGDPNHETMCAALHWQSLSGAIDDPARGERAVRMPLASGEEYTGWRSPDGVTPQYQPAIIAAFKPTRLVVVKGGEPDEMERAHRAAAKSGYRVDEEDA